MPSPSATGGQVLAAPGRHSGAAAQTRGERALRRLATASLASQVGIVVTGGAVRLTGSGLGCPTFPSCTEDSLTNTPEFGLHGAIEFGNRLLTFVLVAIALATVIAAWRRRPARTDLRVLAAVLLAGIPAQAMIGGLTVLTRLNPWVVMWHFLLSMALIGVATVLWRRTRSPQAPAPSLPSRWVRRLAAGVVLVAFAVLAAGTVVTGAGPHAGDESSPRNGLDLATVSQVHADAVALLIGMSVGLWFAVRAAGTPGRASRATTTVLATEAAQSLVGVAQYHLGVPPLLVGIHMLGAALLTVAVIDAWLSCGGVKEPTPAATP